MFPPPLNNKVVTVFGQTLFNKVAIVFSLSPCSASESHVAIKHLKHISQGDLLILDRGYKSLWLMLAIVQMGGGSLILLSSNAFMEVAPYNFLALTQYSLRIFQLPVEPFLKKVAQINSVTFQIGTQFYHSNYPKYNSTSGEENFPWFIKVAGKAPGRIQPEFLFQPWIWIILIEIFHFLCNYIVGFLHYSSLN